MEGAQLPGEWCEQKVHKRVLARLLACRHAEDMRCSRRQPLLKPDARQGYALGDTESKAMTAASRMNTQPPQRECEHSGPLKGSIAPVCFSPSAALLTSTL